MLVGFGENAGCWNTNNDLLTAYKCCFEDCMQVKRFANDRKLYVETQKIKTHRNQELQRLLKKIDNKKRPKT